MQQQSVFSNDVFRAPMVQPRTLVMLRLCRKIIFQEFGIKLVFTQDDLLQQITTHAKRSRNPNLHQLADLLQKELA